MMSADVKRDWEKEGEAIERRFEQLKREIEKKPPPTWEEVQDVRKNMMDQSNEGAQSQVWRALPPGEPDSLPEADKLLPVDKMFPPNLDRLLSSMGFYHSFLASDGHETALARLMVAATNAAMDCFARAGTLEPPVRAIELNLATKLSLTVAALSKALDSHRGPDWPGFIDDGSARSSSQERFRSKDKPKSS